MQLDREALPLPYPDRYPAQLTAGGSLTLIFALAPLQHTVPLSMASSVSVTLNAVTLENVFNALEPNCSLAWFSLDTQKRRVAMEELPSSIPDLVKEAFVFASFCTREDRFVADALKTDAEDEETDTETQDQDDTASPPEFDITIKRKDCRIKAEPGVDREEDTIVPRKSSDTPQVLWDTFEGMPAAFHDVLREYGLPSFASTTDAALAPAIATADETVRTVNATDAETEQAEVV